METLNLPVFFQKIENADIGVTLFANDIEKPSPQKDTLAYHFFGNLDFEVAYFRNNYAL